MELNKKSFHVWLYKITYNTNRWSKNEGQLPNNLCPYFWKLVIAFLVLIPNFVLQLPLLISDLFTTDKFEENKPGEYRMFGLISWITLVLTGLYIYSVIHWFKMMFNAYSYDQGLAICGIIITSIFVGIIAIWRLFVYLKDRPYKEKQPSIVKEFIKAKYNNYCPKIDWKQ